MKGHCLFIFFLSLFFHLQLFASDSSDTDLDSLEKGEIHLSEQEEDQQGSCFPSLQFPEGLLARLLDEGTIFLNKRSSTSEDATKALKELMKEHPEFTEVKSRALLSCQEGMFELVENKKSQNLNSIARMTYLASDFPGFIEQTRTGTGKFASYVLRDNKRTLLFTGCVGIFAAFANTGVSIALDQISAQAQSINDSSSFALSDFAWEVTWNLTRNLVFGGTGFMIATVAAKISGHRTQLQQADMKVEEDLTRSFEDIQRLHYWSLNSNLPRATKEAIRNFITNLAIHALRRLDNWKEELESDRFSFYTQGPTPILRFIENFWSIILKAAKKKENPLVVLDKRRIFNEKLAGIKEHIGKTENPYKTLLSNPNNPSAVRFVKEHDDYIASCLNDEEKLKRRLKKRLIHLKEHPIYSRKLYHILKEEPNLIAQPLILQEFIRVQDHARF